MGAKIKTKDKTRLNFPHIFQPQNHASYFSSTLDFSTLALLTFWATEFDVYLAASLALTYY